MSFDPAAALVAYHAVLDAQDVDGVAKCLAPEARYVSPAIGDVVGREAILASIRAYFAASPDHQAFDDEVKATGPRSAQSHWRLRAVNKTTGAVTERRGIERVTFNEAGLITLIDVVDLD